MKFSTKSTYGLRAVVRLAENWGKGKVSLAAIAREEKISLGYLERLFSRLKEADLIKAEKGVTGGYSLTKSPDKISALEVINTLEGEKSLFYCLAEGGKVYCSKSCHCGASLVLAKAQEALNEALGKIKLSELVKTHNT